MTEVHSAPVEQTTAPEAPALPDFLVSPNAVFNDLGVKWRYGKAPDYSKTRKVWEEGKKMNHAAGSLEQIVENLVKNWEVEASFKPELKDWRTIDHQNYTFSMNGGPPQTAEHMLKVGTYNAIIAPSEYYDPNNSDFASSHKTFKRMMPTFAWEVIEVYSPPPKVAFKWRHWGMMKNDYVGFNNKGQKVTCKAHGGPIEIFGITIAQVDDQTRLQAVDTWMDPLDMFRQIAPHGIVNSEPMSHKVALADALDALPDNDGIKIAKAHEGASGVHGEDLSPESVMGKHVSNSTGQAADAFVPGQGACPFMGGSQTNGNAGQAPHPLPIRALNGNAMNVDASPTGIESTDATVVDTDRPAPQLVAPMPDTETKDSRLEEATDQGAAMEVDPQFSSPDTQMANDGETLTSKRPAEDVPRSIYSSSVTGNVEESIKAAKRDVFVDEPTATGTRDAIDEKLESSADQVHSHPKDIEQAVRPQAGEAVIAPADSRETQETMKEMSEIRPEECPAVMNRE